MGGMRITTKPSNLQMKNEELGANFEYKDEIPEGMEARMGGGPKMFPGPHHLLILRPRII